MNLAETELPQPCCDVAGLSVADLEHERAARNERLERRAGDRLVAAFADQRLSRLDAQLGLERVELGGGDVRRVGDHEVERALLSCEKVTVHEPHPSVQGRAAPILLRDLERGRGDVGRDDPDIGPLVRDRERDRAGADADFEDGWRLDVPEKIEAALDDALGLRPRDQDAGIDDERQPAEAPLAEDVRERLARGSPRNERAVAVELVGRRAAAPALCSSLRRPPKDVGEQPLGVHLRRGTLGPLERGRALGESLSNGHTAAASSALRRSSSPSAPVNSSSSPPSTASSRCAVSLTR